MQFIAECPTTIFGISNYFYILSDNQTNANNAKHICRKLNGTLAEILSSKTRGTLVQSSVRKHIPLGWL